MILYPAIDLSGGKVVRLLQGDYGRSTVYSEDPLAVAKGFSEAGAACLHVVDLDGAKEGKPVNEQVIFRLIRESGLFVEVGGGIRDRSRAERFLNAGAGRVILGTAALEDRAFLREMLREFGAKIAVGVDAKSGRVATRGWLSVTETDAFSFVRAMREEGVQTVIYTDIARDGTLSGSNLDAYRQLVSLSGLDIIASGGIASVEELTRLAEIGVAGAILGKSLYTGNISLEEALSAVGGK